MNENMESEGGSHSLPNEARVVIVGGGIVGCSVAWHLTRLGWKNVVLLEQNQLAGGTTWHAAGLVGRLRTTNVLTRINKYSVELYSNLEKETGHPVGWKQVGSLILARSEARMTQLRRTAAMSEWFGVEVQLIDRDVARERWPLLRVDDILGAAWLPHDGKVIPKEVAIAMAKGASARGAAILDGVKVLGIETRHGRACGVKTSSGSIRAEHVVLCGGMWTRELGLRCGVTIPLYPVEHHYLVTRPIEGAHDDLPVGRDPDLCLYFRGEGNAVVLGAFQAESKPWMIDRVPEDFSFQLLEPDWEKFAEPLRNGQHRIPALQSCEFEKFVNGPESFTPDNNFIIGETPEVRGLYVAAGFNSVGIASAGGAGKYLADWIIAGEPTLDLWSVDIRRFGPWANNRAFLRARVVEVLGLHYQLAWPNREPETGRGMRKSPLHERLAAAGASFGVKNGWERPNWFARIASTTPGVHRASMFPARSPQEPAESTASLSSSRDRGGDRRGEGTTFLSRVTEESRGEGISPPIHHSSVFRERAITDAAPEYSFSRQNWFPNHAWEHLSCREHVAIFDQSAFGKLVVQGRDAMALLQRLSGANVDVPVGRVVYTGMFNSRGGFESDLTMVRTAEHAWYLITGTAQPLRDLDWITRHMQPAECVECIDVTNAWAVLGVMGPNSRLLLSRLTDADLSNESFPFGTMQRIGIGMTTVRAVRITYVGELGWELHVPVEQALELYDRLIDAAGDQGVVNAGHYAINSLRLEKGYRAWGADISPDDNPFEAGLAFAIDWNKAFIGREALLTLRRAPRTRRMGIFIVQDPEPVLWGGELIYADDRPVGYTSSGSYGHSLGGAIGMGYINNPAEVTREAIHKARYEIAINGTRFPACLHLRAPYDPERRRILV
jgi:4-methylaminobutanoate oxidase (formaldehyde-forming)